MPLDPTQDAGAATTRSVSQWERALLARWFAGTERSGAQAVVAAYVSDRSQDEPRLRNMIVIAETAKSDVTYLIHRPLGESAWILTCGRTDSELGRFRTLPEALNTIRPHRSLLAASPSPLLARLEERLADITSGQ